MDTTSGTEFITCAQPTCGARVPITDSTYVDGAGHLCHQCDPLPDWVRDIELPY